MENNAVRVVIDTNIWISFLIGKSLSSLSDAINSDKVCVLFSDDLFNELLEVLKRPKFKKYFSDNAIEALVSVLYEKVELIKINQNFNDCRDPKDNFLLDLSVSGYADYLVTGDVDLLVLNPFHGVKVISYQSFQSYILNNFK
jgi:uncharacterized protein